jgi:hypothetical protein
MKPQLYRLEIWKRGEFNRWQLHRFSDWLPKEQVMQLRKQLPRRSPEGFWVKVIPDKLHHLGY